MIDLHEFDNVTFPAGPILEIGAAHGYLTEKLKQSGHKVFAFEAFIPNINELIVKYQYDEDVMIVPLAVSDHVGVVEFYPCGNVFAGTCNKEIAAGPYSHNKEPHIIDCITIDRFIEEERFEELSSIVIDVEGYEVEVINGALETINKFNPVIAIKVNSNISVLYQLIMDLGYSIRDVNGEFVKLIAPNQVYVLRKNDSTK